MLATCGHYDVHSWSSSFWQPHIVSILQEQSQVEGGKVCEVWVARWHRSAGGLGRQRKPKEGKRCPFFSLLVCTVGWTEIIFICIYIHCQETREEKVKGKTFDPLQTRPPYALCLEMFMTSLTSHVFRADLGTVTSFSQDQVEKGLELSQYFSPKGSFRSNF